MTFLDMAKQERNILNEEHLIQDLCPSDLGYEPKEKCKAIIGLEEKDKAYICRRCWEREMPNTEESEYAKGVKAGLDSIECEVKKSYEKGLNDAWELICKINKLSIEESEKVYGKRFQYITDIIENLTPQEALAKLKAYEEAQIEVGDVVKTVNGECPYIVTNVQLPNTLHVINGRNGYAQQIRIDVCKKTGKHLDISSILERIGE